MAGFTFGVFLAACFSIFGVPLLMWFLGNALRSGAIPGERTVLATPLAGWLYERIFAPETFYSMDTALMFQKAVHLLKVRLLHGRPRQSAQFQYASHTSLYGCQIRGRSFTQSLY